MPVSASTDSSRSTFAAFFSRRTALSNRRRWTTSGLKTSPAAARSRVRSVHGSALSRLRSRTTDSRRLGGGLQPLDASSSCSPIAIAAG